MGKFTEQDKSYIRELVWKNAVELFEKKKSMSPNVILKTQKRLINKYNILGKNKYKSVKVLENYFKNPNKHLAEQIFWNTVYHKFINQ